MTELKWKVTSITERTKPLQSKMDFIEKDFVDFRKERNLNEIKELKETKNSLHEIVEAFLQAFDSSSNKLHSKYNNFMLIQFKLQYKYFLM